jgi:WD40 repeat protein
MLNKEINVNEWLLKRSPEEQRRILSEIASRLIDQKNYVIATSLLLNYDFLNKKIFISNPQSLIKDYNKTLENISHFDDEIIKSLQILNSFFQRSKHLLEKDKEQLNSQLTGSLTNNLTKHLDELLENVRNQNKEVWIKPILPTFNPLQGSLKRVFTGHTDEISAICINKEKTNFISGSENGQIKIWNIKTGMCTVTLSSPNDDETILNIKEIKDNYLIVLSRNDKRNFLTLWDLKNRKILVTRSGINKMLLKTIVTFENDEYVLTIDPGNNNTLVVWEIPSLNPIQYIDCEQKVFSFTVYQSGYTKNQQRAFNLFSKKDVSKIIEKSFTTTLIVSYGDEDANNNLEISEWRNGMFHAKNLIETNTIQAEHFEILPHINQLLIWDYELIVIINIGTLEIKHQIDDILESEDDIISAVLYVKNTPGLLIFLGSEKVLLFDLNTLSIVNEFEGDENPKIEIIKQGKYAISWGMKGKLQLWDLENAQLISSLLLWSSSSIIKGVDENWLLSSDAVYNIGLWNINSDQPYSDKSNHTEFITSLKPFKKENLLVTSSMDTTLKVFDLINFKCTHTLTGHKTGISDIDIFINEKGLFAVSVTGLPETSLGKIKIWDLNTGKCKKSFKVGKVGIQKSKVLKGGRFLIVMDEKYSLYLIDIKKTKIIYEIEYSELTDELRSLRFPVEGLKNTVIEVSSGALYPHQIFQLFDNEKKAIVGYYDGLMKIIDIISGTIISHLDGHNKPISSIEIDETKNLILTSSQDNTIKLWDLKHYNCIKTYNNNHGVFKAMLIETPFSEEVVENGISIGFEYQGVIGNTLMLSVGWDKTLKLWELRSGELIYSKVYDELFNIIHCQVLNKSKRVYLSTHDGHIFILDLMNGSIITSSYLGRGISSTTILEDERTIIVGETTGQLHFVKIVN